MTSISGSFILLCCLHISQLLCSAAPILLEMTQTNPSTGQVIQTEINVDDSVIENVLRERITQPISSVSEARITPDMNEDVFYDYYDLDCAMPIMPELLHDEKEEENLMTRQISRPTTHNVMDTIVGGLNGIAMSVAAAGFGVYNFLRFS